MFSIIKKIFIGTALNLIFVLPVFAEKRIAVLPFEVLSTKEEYKQFGLGTTDTLSNALSKISDLVMLDRSQINAVMKELAFQQSGFSDEKTSLKVGKLLNAEILVLGSIQEFNGKFRINAHFTEVETGKIVKIIDPITGNDIFELQDILSNEIIKLNKLILTDIKKDSVKKAIKATTNVKAYIFYTKARNNYLLFTNEGYKKAIELYDKALEVDQNYTLALAGKAEAQALLAHQLKLNGEEYQDKLKEAESNALSAIEKDNTNNKMYRALSFVYNIKGDLKNAKLYAEKALELNDKDAETYISLWFSDREKGLDPESPLVKKALSLNPYSFAIYFNLAIAYSYQDKYEEAIKNYKKAIALNPNFADAYYSLAISYVELDQLDEAIKNYKKAIELRPKFADYHYNLGFAYYKKEDFDNSIKSYLNAISIKPNDWEYYTSLASSYYDKGNFVEAYKNYQSANTLAPNEARPLYGLGLTNAEFGNVEEAIKNYKKAIELEPNYIAAYNNLGIIYKNKGYLEEASKLYNKILEIEPKYANAYHNLGNVYYFKNDFDNAIKHFLKAIELKPKFYRAYTDLGSSYYAQGKLAEAEKCYLKSIEINPKFDETYNHLGVLFYAKNDLTQAIINYKKAITINPNYSNAYYNLGISYHKQGNISYALKNYEKACSLGLKSACEIQKN